MRRVPRVNSSSSEVRFFCVYLRCIAFSYSYDKFIGATRVLATQSKCKQDFLGARYNFLFLASQSVRELEYTFMLENNFVRRCFG